MSLRPVKSPVAPKITMMQGLAGFAPRPVRPNSSFTFRLRTVSVILFLGSLRSRRFHVAAELLPHRRQDLFREGVLLARTEADVECRGQHAGTASSIAALMVQPPSAGS